MNKSEREINDLDGPVDPTSICRRPIERRMHRDSNCASQIEIVLVQLSASERRMQVSRTHQRWTYIPDLKFDAFLSDIDHFGTEFSADRVCRIALD